MGFYRRQNFHTIQREYRSYSQDIQEERAYQKSLANLLQSAAHHMLTQKNTPLLRENESVIIQLRRHWSIIFSHPISISLFIITTIVLIIYRENSIDILGDALFWAIMSLFWIVWWSIIMIRGIMDMLIMLIITERHILSIDRIWLISHNMSKYSLDQVQEVSARMSGTIQTTFRFWSIYIKMEGEHNDIVIGHTPDPIENARRINDIISEYRNGKSQTQAGEAQKEVI